MDYNRSRPTGRPNDRPALRSPAPASQPQTDQPQPISTTPAQPSPVQHHIPVHGSSWSKKSIIALLITAVVLIGAWSLVKWMGIGSPINKNEYQAVFLASDSGGVQAYFGHLKNTDGSYLQLDDVYYLQPAPAASEEQKSSNGSQSLQSQNSQPQLIRLGQEIHKPHGTMYIKADQVLFWENLQSDSKIMEAIKQAKEAQ